MKTETVGRGAPQTHDTEDLHLCAYNGAFWDLGFKWQWDMPTYRELCNFRDEKERIRIYVERHQSHLLKAYDPDFLVNLIHDHKTQRHAAIAACQWPAAQPEL